MSKCLKLKKTQILSNPKSRRGTKIQETHFQGWEDITDCRAMAVNTPWPKNEIIILGEY